MLAADVVVISDSSMFDRGIPSICYGLRGSRTSRSISAGPTATCTRVFGGTVAIRDGAGADAGQMRDKVAASRSRFYDDVRELTPEERAEWQKLPWSDRKYQKELARRSCSASRFTTTNAVGGRPSK